MRTFRRSPAPRLQHPLRPPSPFGDYLSPEVHADYRPQFSSNADPQMGPFSLPEQDSQAIAEHLQSSGYPLGDLSPQMPQQSRWSRGLDNAALAVIGESQGSQPHNFGQGLFSGFASGLAGGRARDALTREQNQAKAIQSAEDLAKERRAAARGFASQLATHRWDLQKQAQQAQLERELHAPRSLADIYAEHQAMAQGTAAGSGQDESGVLSDEDAQTLGHFGAAGGQLPTFGFGKNGNASRTKTLHYMAGELRATGGDLNANRAVAKGLTTSYSNIRKMYDNTTAFENTALKNSDILVRTLQGLSDSGSPVMNKPVRSWDRNVLGSTNVTSYETARRIVAPEFARLLASATASGVLSDDARKEAMSTLPSDATGAQVLAALTVLREDAGNRRQSYSDQLQTIHDAFHSIGANDPDGDVNAEEKKLEVGLTHAAQQSDPKRFKAIADSVTTQAVVNGVSPDSVRAVKERVKHRLGIK